MQGPKTHEQQLRILERKDSKEALAQRPTLKHPEARQSELPVSRAGMNQESDHNKHNDPGQAGHSTPKPTPAQEKKGGQHG